MTTPVDPSLRELDACGCCEGTGTVTPMRVANRPGLAAISYRAGTQAAFLRSLESGLTAAERPALADLKTREADDFSIALLDGWATIAGVLTFYQERIANESYLRTATERRSVLELARTIGYELAPGIAAGTLLAFTFETAAGAPPAGTVELGTKVQSVPRPGERPQTFETVEAIVARPELNALRPRQTAPSPPAAGDVGVYIAGVDTGLQPGDAVLLVGGERASDPADPHWGFRRLVTVEPDPIADRTLVTWAGGLANVPAEPRLYALRLQTSLFGSAAPDWRLLTDDVRNRYLAPSTSDPNPSKNNRDPDWPGLTLAATALAAGDADTIAGHGLRGDYFAADDLTQLKFTRADANVAFDFAAKAPGGGLPADHYSVRWTGWVIPRFTETYTFFTTADDGTRLWIDGTKILDDWSSHGAREATSTPVALVAGRPHRLRLEYFQDVGPASVSLSWKSAGQAKEVIPAGRLLPPIVVHLAPTAPQLLPGGWIVLSTPGRDELYELENVAESARSAFALAGKTTRLELRGPPPGELNEQVRSIAAFAHSERLEVAERPIADPVTGDAIVLDRLVASLPDGRRLIVSGRRSRAEVQAGSPLTLTAVDGAGSRPLVTGESLVVVRRTIPPSGDPVWRLVDATGVEGTVTASAARLALRPARAEDPLVSEPAILRTAETVAGPRTRLALELPLANVLDRTTATIAANVAAATHGETRNEVLGSGDAATPFQRFTLRESPLTFTRNETAAGGESTLAVHVNGVRWDSVPTLYGRGPRERVYTTRLADDGSATVQFGDGASGARPPTGRENIQATYRRDSGEAGNLAVDQLSLPLTRPLGLKAVTNPLAATGGTDPQALADARDNAPRTVLTLDRVVSLRDFELFAGTYAGIGKALATWTWDVDRRGVLITVAGPDGAPVSDAVRASLLGAIRAGGDPRVPVAVRAHRPIGFRLGATFAPDPERRVADVLAAIEAALRARFSFAARDFGQPVALSEAIAVIQAVPGVVAVDMDRLYRGSSAELRTLLTAASPAPGAPAATTDGAELLTIDLRSGDVQVAA